MGRVIACNQTNGGHPDKCYDEAFNLILSPYWQYLPVETNIKPLLEEIAVKGTIPTQNVLYDLPFYYMGQ